MSKTESLGSDVQLTCNLIGHQVKKSKKWSCKVCGEKQSLIKEYGRGTAADCRRHVQKLNSLRGELLEVDNEKALTQWEKEEECEVEVGPGDDTQGCDQKGQVESRWSKYVAQKENEPGCDEDEPEEEESIYTDREWYCTQRNNTRKRKKSFTSGGACRRYTVGVDENLDTAHWGASGRPPQSRRHNATFTSPPQVTCASIGFPRTSTNQMTDALTDSPAATLGSKHISAYDATCSWSTGANKSSAELSTKPQPSGPLGGCFTSSFSPKHPHKSKPDIKDSKWAQFLPPVCVGEIKDKGDSGEEPQDEDVDHSGLAQSLMKAVPLKETGSTSSGKALIEKVTIFEKPSHSVTGNVCKQPNSPTITSKPVGFQSPVCVQPLPIKRPCLDLPFSTLFHTDEDFDDTY
ncbi:MRN complex-interacting protein [Silurus asotus]|uniref:MRN complex-interacting protein n=1 Tax=Silurus asotus TaxID=30991 RepID=A0AAD5B031_SILAS|nr:MRN complex-interacting protein [Silurus asotus]